MSYVIEHEPDVLTDRTKIWTVDAKNHPYTVGYWLIYAPWAHPAWKYHLMSLIHLRDSETGPKAKIAVPGATHELMIFALDPKYEPDPYDARLLEPVSIAQQFIAENDAAALNVLEQRIPMIAAGVLSPDSDYRKAWERILLKEAVVG